MTEHAGALERRIRLVRRTGNREAFDFTYRIWKSSPRTLAGVPDWLACYALETGFPSLRVTEHPGLDDMHALSICLMQVETMLVMFHQAFEVWMGDYPFEPASTSIFFGTAAEDARKRLAGRAHIAPTAPGDSPV